MRPIVQPATTESTSSWWLYNGSLLVAVSAIIGFVVFNLDFNDPRPLFNAWTYLIAAPTGILLLGLFARYFDSRWIERTLQAAFLLSLAIHLMILMGAFHLVLLRSISSRTTALIASQKREQDNRRDAFSEVSYQPKIDGDGSASLARAILRSELQDSQASDADLSLQAPQTQLAELSSKPLENALPDARDVSERSAAKLQRAARPIEQAEITSRTQAIQRQPLDNSDAYLPREASSIAVPEQSVAPETNLAGIPQLLPREIELPLNGKANALASDRIKSSSWIAPQRDLDDALSQATQRLADATPSTKLSQANNANRRDQINGSLEEQLERNSRQAAMPRSDQIGQPLSPSDFVMGSQASLPINAATPTDLPPAASSTDIANLGLERGDSRMLILPGPTSNSTGSIAASSPGPSLPLGPRDTSLSTDSRLASNASSAIANAARGSSSARLPTEIGSNRARAIERTGPLSLLPPSAAAAPAPAFAKRTERNSSDAAREDLGRWGPQTEEAIEGGLKFLSNFQHSNGSWSLADFDSQPIFASDTAATGLSLLAFQGAGYSHRQYQYQKQCQAALDYLISHQKPDGDLYIPMNELSDRNAQFYSHGIAALALCEAFGMTQDERLRQPAQLSIDFLAKTQDPIGGAWRYSPGVESDTSVEGWCMMAIKSADLAGLEVDPSLYDGIKKHLDRAAAGPNQQHLYRYNPTAADQPMTRHGLRPSPTMTSVGLLSRLYLGWRRDNPNMVAGADYILKSPPQMGTARSPDRDTYYWYYATQIIFHMGGDYWQSWHNALHPMLIETQENSGRYIGSWDPGGPIPDRWGKFAGRLYVTTLNLLSLEVYYRHLPIYEETAR